MGDTKEPVVFLLPDGTEISNDPRHADAKMRAQLEQQMATFYPNSGNTRVILDDEAEDEESEDEGEDDGLEDLTADELKAHVQDLKDRGIEVNTAGVKKKSELVDAIRAAQA